MMLAHRRFYGVGFNRLLTQMIGSPILLDDRQQRFLRWCEDLAQSPVDRTVGAPIVKEGTH